MSGWMMSLGGGLLIGMSATILLWFNGRIAGISGIVNGLNNSSTPDRAWRIAFLLGLLIAGGLTMRSMPMLTQREGFPISILLISVILVGVGTSMSNGCTSGHGVCGLGRLSVRSLIAVLTFMVAAMLTVYIVRHLMGVL
jgi:uncharacterized protein